MTIKVAIPDCDDVDGVVFYELIVTNESGREWRIDKRYNEFKELDKEIVADGALAKKKGELPTAGHFGIRKSLRLHSFMDARKDGLIKYMQKLCDQVATLEDNPVLHRFLRAEEHHEVEAEPWRCVALEANKEEDLKPVTEPADSHEARTEGDVKPALEAANSDEATAKKRASRRSSSVPQRRRKSQVKPKKHNFTNVYERRVLSAGILKFHEELVIKPEFDVSEMPQRPNGSLVLMPSSNNFLKRLLTHEIQFEGCMKADIASSQPDLKRLSLEHLLSIRSRTLDFTTESESHSAHTNFLTTLDKHLYEKLARRILRVGAAKLPEAPGPLMSLGYEATLRLGAAQLLKSGWDHTSKESSPSPNTDGYPNGRTTISTDLPHLAVPVPDLWSISLDKEKWEGCCLEGSCSLAFFHCADVWLQLAPGDTLDVCDFVEDEEYVAVVADQDYGKCNVRKDRMLQWVVHVLDATADTFFSDFADEIERSVQAASSPKRVASELAETMKRRTLKAEAAAKLALETEAVHGP